jgi:multiple sugar transport system permease protein
MVEAKLFGEARMLGKSAAGSGQRTRFRNRLARREALEGYLYLLPWAVGFIVFVAGPMIVSLGLSLTNYDLIRAPVFSGIDNYVRAFSADDLFWPSLGRTFYYAAAIVPLTILASLLLALFLNSSFRGRVTLRTIAFVPHLVPIVAGTLVWVWIFHPRGLLNYLLSLVGIPGPGWLTTIEWAIPALVLMGVWRAAGGNTMIIFLAALQGVPAEFYEAAEIDGADRLQRFLHITLPMISPAVFFNLTLGVIAALKVFAPAFVATQGGPAYATWFYALHLYQHAFRYLQMGYASALAWIFLVIVLTLTWVQFRTSAHWVHYEGETR